MLFIRKHCLILKIPPLTRSDISYIRQARKVKDMKNIKTCKYLCLSNAALNKDSQLRINLKGLCLNSKTCEILFFFKGIFHAFKRKQGIRMLNHCKEATVELHQSEGSVWS